MSDRISAYYNSRYYEWQDSLGEFGGWANQTKFAEYIAATDDVMDFGCGGGFLLKGLRCNRKLGVEINPAAIEVAQKNGIEVFQRVDDIPDESLDVVISDNALEHTFRPLDELRSIHKKLRRGGRIILVVPCETVLYRYRPNDINHHLYSWSPMCIGNLCQEAGFSVVESKPYIHKWPPHHRLVAKVGGRWLFEVACRVTGILRPSWFQIRVVGKKID